MNSFRSKPVGWRYESQRHSLAAKGFSTRYRSEKGIDLVDIRKYKFGSVGWQDAMVHNIREKKAHDEELGPAEKVFVKTQAEHMGLYAKKLDELKSYEKLKQKHELGGEIDTNVEKLDSSIAAVRREMDQLLPKGSERGRRDTNSLTEEDKEKAKEWFALESKLKDLKVRRQRLVDARQYYASKTSQLLDKAIDEEEKRVIKAGGGPKQLPSSAESINLDVESLKIGRPIMMLSDDPSKTRSVFLFNKDESRKLVNWEQINRKRAKEYLKEHGTLDGFKTTHNFEASLEQKKYNAKKVEMIRDPETGLRFEWNGSHTVNVYDESGVEFDARSIGNHANEFATEQDFKRAVSSYLKDRTYDEYIRGDVDVKRRYEDALRKRSLRQVQGRGDK